MGKLISVVILLALVGCSASSGLTYSVRVKQLLDKRVYTVDCRGIVESLYSCIDTAKRICVDKQVRTVDGATGKSIDLDVLKADASMSFICADETALIATPGQPVTPQPAEPISMIPLSTDVLFGFNRFDSGGITEAGRIELQKAIAEFERASPSQLTITGFTDRIGSDAYNFALSSRRAEAVRQFLRDHGVRVPIVVRGLGKRQPGTSCTAQERLALIDCLAPDRMVEITFPARVLQPPRILNGQIN
ncbi:OmpA family protein [Burkholderia pseudomallei]|uniref:OmpA family protein n=1 Tax=Burkholderia pseudomallei TaxID=28450 RepID=UPI000A1A0E62|nr:OmpA family protein [Burkholderia pseudomallei]ARL38811.1 hypothetical protein BOC49_21360 [Burkholderia pseudomallei]